MSAHEIPSEESSPDAMGDSQGGEPRFSPLSASIGFAERSIRTGKRFSTRIAGKLAEEWAKAYLEKSGLWWICSNYRCPGGEIDLIMREGSVLVFVEVRYREDLGYGEGVETVVWRKQQRLIKAAWHYLLEIHAVDKVNARFDVIGLSSSERIHWIPNAFEVKY